jgi:hypothetical protein
MANETDNSFLTSVKTAASTTASSLANLSDRLKDPSPELNPDASGEETMHNPRSQTPDPAKPVTVMNVQKRNSGRIHSHTISGDRPPVIITNPKFMPSPQRRNSDGGSPRPPLPIALADDIQPAAPVTATTATTEAEIFSSTAPSLSLEHLALNRTKTTSDSGSIHSVVSDSALLNNEAKTPIADPETPVTKDMLLVPRRKSRARGSSVSTANSDTKSVSLSRTNSVSSRKATPTRRKDSDDTENEAGSDVASAAAGSIASACGMDLANAKRNSDYHALFRSVPEDDVLIEGEWTQCTCKPNCQVGKLS